MMKILNECLQMKKKKEPNHQNQQMNNINKKKSKYQEKNKNYRYETRMSELIKMIKDERSDVVCLEEIGKTVIDQIDYTEEMVMNKYCADTGMKKSIFELPNLEIH